MDTFQNEIDQLENADFFQLAKREADPRVRIRLLALGHLQSGKTKTDVVGIHKWFQKLEVWQSRRRRFGSAKRWRSSST